MLVMKCYAASMGIADRGLGIDDMERLRSSTLTELVLTSIIQGGFYCCKKRNHIREYSRKCISLLNQHTTMSVHSVFV